MEKWAAEPSFEALWSHTKKPQVPNCKNIFQKHIARGVEPHYQKRLCPCAIVVCLHPQHTPILIHLKQNIQSGIKPKNKKSQSNS